jgi:uncharacterized protein (TIGR03118 family)
MRTRSRWTSWGLLLVLWTLVAACSGPTSSNTTNTTTETDNAGNYKLSMVPLVSNVEDVAPNRDGKMSDAWGLEFGHKGRIWVNNASGYSTVYDGDGKRIMIDDGTGKQVPLAVKVNVPNDADGDEGAGLTGMVFNEKTDAFKGDSFILASEQGTLTGWAESMKNESMTRVDTSAKGSVYKGLALAQSSKGLWLYATNFSNRAIEVYDSNYKQVDTTGKFTDPDMPANYAPFNIKAINGSIYVTYAEQSIDKENDVAAVGHGYIDVFSFEGDFKKRLVSNGPLNSPWGMALAPADFGSLSGKLLVGNFRDGYINVFDPESGKHLGQVMGKDGKPLQVDMLWALTFGTDNGAGKHNQLFFAAGSSSEESGLFGRLDLVS